MRKIPKIHIVSLYPQGATLKFNNSIRELRWCFITCNLFSIFNFRFCQPHHLTNTSMAVSRDSTGVPFLEK